jgi:hypothetical protein
MLIDQFQQTYNLAVAFVVQKPDWVLGGGSLVLLVLLVQWVRVQAIDQVRRKFLTAGIQPSKEQEEALRTAFAAIAAEGAQQELQERLSHLATLQHDRVQLERVVQLSQTHITIIKEVGATLQALEVEYRRSRKALESDQAQEALRLVVQKSVAQITEMTTAAPVGLPDFVMPDS